MDPIVAVSLHGRLGNNLFEYALGRVRTPSGPVPVDDLWRPSDWLSDALKPGLIRPLSPREMVYFRRLPRLPRGRTALARALGMLTPENVLAQWLVDREYRECIPGRVEPDALTVPGPILLNGLFQNEGYFISIADRLVGDLRPPSREAQDRIASLRKDVGRPTVAVVVRAGTDYQNLGWSRPLRWYLDAAQEVLRHVGSATFAVFSDVSLAAESIAMCLAQFGPAEPVTGYSSIDQLHIVAALDHAVLADSTFAWWGGWLGDHRVGFSSQRIVLVPAPWISVDLNEIAPARWLRLANHRT